MRRRSLPLFSIARVSSLSYQKEISGAIIRLSGLGKIRSIVSSVGGSTLLTPHAHVLLVIAAGHAVRLRDIARELDITERNAQQLVGQLVDAGYLTRHALGKRNFYEIHPDAGTGHPVEGKLTVGTLIRATRDQP